MATSNQAINEAAPLEQSSSPTVNEETGEVSHAITQGSEGLIQEKATNKAFYKFFPVMEKDKDGKNVHVVKDGKAQWDLKIQSKAESQDGSNWKKLEDAGWKLLNENEYIRYKVTTLDSIKALVAEEKQVVYLTQSGISYVMNSKISGMQNEIQEGTGTDPENPPVAVHDGETIDLKGPINEPPGRRQLTEDEKIDKMLAAMGVTDPATRAVMRNTLKAQITQFKSLNPQEDEEESEEVPVA